MGWRINGAAYERAHSECVAEGARSLKQCLRDYAAGKGRAAYYAHIERLRAAHQKFTTTKKGKS